MRHKKSLSSAARIVAIYVVASVSWILLSDRLLEMLVSEHEKHSWFQTLKGWGFVAVTAFILYVVLSRYILRLENLREKLEQRVTEKTADLSRTVDALHGEVRARAEAEETQRQQFQFLQILIDATSVPIFWKNSQGRYVGCNSAFGAFIGRSKNEIIGKSVYELAPKELADIYYKKDEELFVRPGVQVYETSVMPADGVRRDVIFNKATFFNEDGSIGGLVGTILDISERKQAEESLRESDNFNRNLFEQSSIGLALCQMDGKLVDVNSAYAKILGRTIEETIQLTYWDITPKKYFEQEQMQLESLQKTGRYGPYEKEYIHKDGHLIPVRLSGRIIERQGVPFIWSSVEDITERKQAQEALQKAYDELELRVAERTAELLKLNESLEREITEHKRAEERLRLTHFSINHSHTEFFWTRPDASIVFVNDYACKVLGYSREELLKLKVFDIDPNYPPERWPAHWKELQQKGAMTFESLHKAKDGRFIPVEIMLNYFEFGGEEYIFASIHDITERRAAEEKIANLAKIPSENPYPILRIGWDGRVLYANEVSEPYLAQWGMQVGSFVPENIRRIMGEAVESCTNQEIELTHSGRVFSFTVVPIMDSFYCNFYGRDVTESKQAEAVLRDSEERFRAIFDKSFQFVLILDTNGNILEMNELAYTVHGPLAEVSVGKPVGEAAWWNQFPEVQEKTRSAIQKCQAGKSVSDEVTFIDKDFRSHEGIRIFSPITDKNGKLRFIVLTGLDISERKRVEEQLVKVNRALWVLSQCNEIMVRAREEKDFLNAVCTSIVDYGGYRLVWVGAVEEENNTVRPIAYAGYEDGYLSAVKITWGDTELGRGPIGTAIRTGDVIICGDILTDPTFAPWRDEAAKRGYRSVISLPLIEGGGTIGALSIYASEPNAFASEEIELLTELANDIAYGITAIRTRKERERAEAAGKRLNRELVRKNKELESIIFVASHDLRSALVNVQGFSRELGMTGEIVRTALAGKNVPKELMEQLQKPLEEDIPEAVEFITNSTAKIDSLLNGLLRLSRVGREEMNVVRLDMNAIIAEIIRNVQFRLTQANARVEVDPLLPCMGDYSLISQVFASLIDNSIKFFDKTRPGLIRITCRTSGGQPVYCVEDNGVGIAPEYQGKIFEVFQRLTPEETPGEGLGLSIVRQIVERHNGRVWIESQYGKGSKFFVSLPAVNMV